MLLEAPQIWRMKRYNVLETELVYSEFDVKVNLMSYKALSHTSLVSERSITHLSITSDNFVGQLVIRRPKMFLIFE